MADLLPHPHDGLFRSVFSETAEASALLSSALPADISDQLDWPTLTLVEGSFLDDSLRECESDLLFQIDQAGTGQPVKLYVLLEHQSTPDRWMPFRLLKYCCRIWDAALGETPDLARLPPVLPVVFYQGKRGWTPALEFSELFPEETRSWPWLPRFEYLLLNDAKRTPEGVLEGEKGRVARLMMMSWSSPEHREAALPLAGELAAQLYDRYGPEVLRQFMAYLLATHEQKDVDLFTDSAISALPAIEGDIVSYAEQLLAKGEARGEARGRAEGERRGKAEVVEGLLRAGVGWEVIKEAAGLDESGYRALRERIASPT